MSQHFAVVFYCQFCVTTRNVPALWRAGYKWWCYAPHQLMNNSQSMLISLRKPREKHHKDDNSVYFRFHLARLFILTWRALFILQKKTKIALHIGQLVSYSCVGGSIASSRQRAKHAISFMCTSRNWHKIDDGHERDGETWFMHPFNGE